MSGFNVDIKSRIIVYIKGEKNHENHYTHRH